jgi:choline-phosphate cytidylyltransferase
MKKIVITYGTFDQFHEGHKRLLERAKALGDYLIVGVTSDSFDRSRGKINVSQSLSERLKNVRESNIADKIIVEEYEGQKIDDIKRYNVDIFTVGSDWSGKFDYLNQYCKVVYLERTKGISSTKLRSVEQNIRIGLIGKSNIVYKFARASKSINGVLISGIKTEVPEAIPDDLKSSLTVFSDYESLFQHSDAVYIVSGPRRHYEQIKKCLEEGKHVLCESPLTLTVKQWREVKQLAKEKNLVLFDSLKTAYSTAYYHLLLLIKSGAIGNVVSIDSTSTSLRNVKNYDDLNNEWSSICSWGPTDMLPVFQILGCQYKEAQFSSIYEDPKSTFDLFTKISFNYSHATATTKSGIGIKSEGDLIVSGTKGYIYVPAPWWKTDYFEIRYENQADNKKVFYQLEDEGIPYEILSFIRSIAKGIDYSYISDEISLTFVKVIEQFNNKTEVNIL